MLFYLLYVAIIIVSCTGYIYYNRLVEKTRFDHIVSFYLIVISLDILVTVLFRELIPGYQYVDLFAPFGLIYGPLLYFCILVAEDRVLSRKIIIIHLLPFFSFLLIFVFLLAYDSIRMSYSKIMYNVLFSVFGISWIFYPIVVFVKANKSKLLVFEIKRLFYYSIILLFLISAFIIPLITSSIIHSTIYRSPISGIIMYSIMFLATLIICNYYYKRYVVTKTTIMKFTKHELHVEDFVQETTYDLGNKSVLYEEIINSYLNQKTYLDPNFSIESMVEDIGLSKTFLINFFKTNYNQSFINKINELRIEEACQYLNSDTFELNIDELAFKNGYSSRASFYRHFNKWKQCSPIEYRAKVKRG